MDSKATGLTSSKSGDVWTVEEFRQYIKQKQFPGQKPLKHNLLVMKPRSRTRQYEFHQWGIDRPFEGKEDVLQRMAINYLKAKGLDAIHVPNGGSRKKVEAAILKGLGVKAGFPDIFVFFPNGPFHGMAIELKVANGEVKDNQIDCITELLKNGYYACVAWSIDGVIDAVNHYLETRKEQ